MPWPSEYVNTYVNMSVGRITSFHSSFHRSQINTHNGQLGDASTEFLVWRRGGEKRTTYESFEKGGFWLVRNRDDLGQTVEDLMSKMCCPVFKKVDDYVPPRPSTITPSSPVCPRPFWGVWQARRWRDTILFCDGALYDFKERVLRSPTPADAKATSEMWQPSKATKLFEHILAFLKEHVETGVLLEPVGVVLEDPERAL